jgi:hypothetical protein
MAKPKTTGKDYGHRTYMNTTSYPEAIGRPSDKQYDNRIKRPHSDDKKPYMPDEYQEMEHYWTPYDPPNLVPPGMPDDPRIPSNRPDNPSTGGGDVPDRGGEFTGCLFGIPRGPLVIQKGETTWSGIGVVISDPLVSLGVNYGPVKVLTSYVDINACHARLTPNCIVGAQALEEFDEADHPHKIGDYFAAQVVATTASGETCAWDISVSNCPPETALEWDYDSSPETIGQDDSVTVYIIGGSGPFKWEVSGTGYTLTDAETSGRQNTLISDSGSCGSAIITVIDGCDDSVIGSVRNTTGVWDEKASQCGLVATPGSWTYNCYAGLEYQWRVYATVTVGYQRQYHKERLQINAAAQSQTSTQSQCEADRAAYNCGSWTSPCFSYPGAWTLTKPPGTCGSNPRWQGTYEECSPAGVWTTRPCSKPGSSWYFIRAAHILNQVELRYWEWECA